MFGFAWVGPAETTFSAAHDREDEEVFALQIEHAEGEFPMLSVEIRNPRRQLLTGPDIWAWLSRDGVPLFFGRLVAIPEQMGAEILRLNFIARPRDYAARKRALAETLKVAPFWDPVWIADERLEDPDTVLEARTQIWHIDRVSHAVTVSDIIAGEDGVVELGGDQIAYDSLDMRYGAPPLRRVQVEAEIHWEQRAQGTIDISQELRAAFGGRVRSYTGQGLEADWPEAGQSLGGGWTIAHSELRRLDGVARPVAYKDVAVAALKPQSDEDGAKAEAFRSVPYRARFYRWEFMAAIVLGYEVRRARAETIRFTLTGDVQRVFSEPGEEEEMILALATQKVTQPLDAGGALPIGDLARPAYARTDRGARSIGYLLALARAKLLARARAVEIEVATPFAAGLALSCRKSATITDARLPGGRATGKITGYRLVADGAGTQSCVLTIACTIGTGGIAAPAPGVPVYVADGYATRYQQRAGETRAAVPGELTFGDLSGVAIDDDGIDFGAMTPSANLRALRVENPAEHQAAVLARNYPDIPAAVEELNRNYTEVWLELRPLTGGPFHTTHDLSVSHLAVPQTMVL